MIIAVASGKGGTGKTTVSVNLANVAVGKVQLFDCDVEEPNADLFLDLEDESEEPVYVTVPALDEDLCTNCGECADFCRFNAVKVLAGKLMIFDDMCHSCGGCFYVCPRNALRESQRRIGFKYKAHSEKISIIKGVLDIGSPLVPPLISEVKKDINMSYTVIVDSPPGTSCAMVTAVHGADAVVLVTEPTPFGLSDLKAAVETVNILGLQFGVVINKYTPGFKGVEEYCSEKGIRILSKIPEDRRVAEACSRGELVSEVLPEYRDNFKEVLLQLQKMTKKKLFL